MSWQAAAIFMLAVLMAMLVNWARSGGLPLLAPVSQEIVFSSGPGHVSLIPQDEALNAFSSGTGVFLDARSPRLYAEGHIPGALNLPWDEFEMYSDRVMGNIPPDALVITYCDGEGCSQGDYLARELSSGGYTDVRVLTSGWSGWVEWGLPVERGYP